MALSWKELPSGITDGQTITRSMDAFGNMPSLCQKYTWTLAWWAADKWGDDILVYFLKNWLITHGNWYTWIGIFILPLLQGVQVAVHGIIPFSSPSLSDDAETLEADIH